MRYMPTMTSIVCLSGLAFAQPAFADIVKAHADHYTLKHEATSVMAPDVLWARLVKPETWWHPDHSYSGVSENLSLDAVAGGFWREDWAGGSVAHGEVLYVKPGEQLRLSAPFGPLQERAVNVVWMITIVPEGGGSKVIFDEVANGTSESGLDALAPAVDFVKSEAIKRLVATDLE